MLKKILLVLKNQETAGIISGFLREMGYQTSTCRESKFAVNVTLEYMPDLVICASEMDVFSGQDVARLFKCHQVLSKIPFLIMAPNISSMEELERAGMIVAADDFIRLPVTQAELYGKVTQWLEGGSEVKSGISPCEIPPKIVKRGLSKSWEKGQVNLISLGRLMSCLIRYKESGILRIRDNLKKMKVTLSRGQIVEVKSNYLRDDSLGRFLILMKKISSQEAEKSFSFAKAKNILQGQALVKMGIMVQNEIDDFIAQHKMVKVFNLFRNRWSTGFFAFTPMTMPKEKEFSPLASTSKILKLGIMKTVPFQDIRKVIERNGQNKKPIYLVKNFDVISDLLELGIQEITAAKQMDEKCVADVSRANPEKMEYYYRLAFLLLSSQAARYHKTDKETWVHKSKESQGTQPETKTATASKSSSLSFDTNAYRRAIKEGRSCFEKKEFGKARPLLEEALNLNPTSSISLALLAWTNLELGGEDNAMVISVAKEKLKCAIGIDGLNDMAYLLLGKIFKEEGKGWLAQSYFRKASEINPANEEAGRENRLLELKMRKNKEFQYKQ